MRKVGIHLSYWCTNWNDDLFPLLAKARDAGFDGAEIPLLNLESLDLPALKAEADHRELSLTCCTGLSPETDISHPDTANRRRGLEYLRRCLEGAALLKSPVLAGVIYSGWGVNKNTAVTTVRYKNSVKSLQSAAEEAEKKGVFLCLEILNRYEGCLLNTVEQGLEFIQAIGSPYVKLHLDTFHMNIEEDSLIKALHLCGKSLGHLHCSENNRKPPGHGSIPWAEIRPALDIIDYKGWLVMECFLQSKGEVGQGTFTHRPLSSDLDADATRGASFLKKFLA